MAGAVGVDVGGSGVRAARVSVRGAVGEVSSVRLHGRSVEAVCEAVERLVAPMQPDYVGVGVPGFLRDGRILASPNFPEWVDVPLANLLQARLGIRVAVSNDANAAALGAWWQRGAEGDLVLLTLGTGVGGGVISEGRLVRGRRGTGAELGHVPVGGDQICACGGRGCLETWASNVGLVRLAAEAGRAVESGGQVMRLADDGEQWAIEVCDRAAEALGRGLVAFANLFAPDVIALAGGLSTSPHRLGRAEQVFHEQVIPANRCPIAWLGRADELAIAGAARLALHPENL